MNEQQVLEIIRQEFRALHLEPPEGLDRSIPVKVSLPGGARSAIAWQRIARRIVSESESDNRRAARTASIVGFAVTRGRTKL